MPKSLELEAGSLEDVAIEAALRKLGKGTTMSDERYAERRKHYAKATDEELEKLGLQYISNSILYGHTTWYHWCIENWDTKWNAYDNKTVNNGCIKFSTAWSSPEKVIEKLAEKYPEAKIEHWWADEDTGNNTGYKAYENGRETENSVGYFNNGSHRSSSLAAEMAFTVLKCRYSAAARVLPMPGIPVRTDSRPLLRCLDRE